MEMDIPAAEELEWLESNAFIDEAEEEDEHFVDQEGDGAVADHYDDASGRDAQILLQGRSAEDEALDRQATKKRLWPAEIDGSAVGDRDVNRVEGRGAKRMALQDEEDEDWLRYSPQKENEATPAVAPGEDVSILDVVAAEIILSRFATDIDGECMPVTAPSGDRIYAKMSSDGIGGRQSRAMKRRPERGLLSERISTLSKKVDEEALRKALRDSLDSPDQPTPATTQVVDEQLWVEKYAPNSFKELLSDERTNREVLLWLKQWDSSVFGSQIRATEDNVLSALRLHSSVVQHQKFAGNRSSFQKNKGPLSNQYLKTPNFLYGEDKNFKSAPESRSRKSIVNHPPEHKVLLLCGSPGLGKTTLAHIAARHCGYRVVEINASDDRSASMIESKILDVIQMNSVMPDAKPKCLIIDEIDGALGDGKGAVEVILKMISAEKKSNVDKDNSAHEARSGKSSSRGHKTAAALSRPVICICNDVYAPALRALRQVAKVHSFVQPTVNRVVNRLKFICMREGFRTSTGALAALAEYTDCDIRSCLNTLQFLNKKKEALNVLDISSQVVGRKDMSRSTFDIWKEVFHKRKSKGQRKFINSCSEHDAFDFLYSLISNRGEYELTMDGIHENFLRLSYHDPMMRKTVKCLNMLGVSDSLLQYVSRTQRMFLHVYQPPIAIVMSRLIAQVEKPNIEWPKTFQRSRALLMENKESLRTWLSRISPLISRHLSIKSFVEDVVSPLLYILSPPTLRPVALHLLSEREKYDLCQLVDTMVSLSINYKNSKPDPPEVTQKYGAAADAILLTLDPPVHHYVNFKDHQNEHFGLTGPMKQILLHEIDKQRILRESTGKTANLQDENNVGNPALAISSHEADGKGKVTLDQRQNVASKNPIPASGNKKTLSSGLNSRTPGHLKKPSYQASSFFDRYKKSNSTDSKASEELLQNVATIERDSRPLIFKYNEGFTNAVKRPVKMRDLLL